MTRRIDLCALHRLRSCVRRFRHHGVEAPALVRFSAAAVTAQSTGSVSCRCARVHARASCTRSFCRVFRK